MNFYQSYVNQRIRTLTPNEIISIGPNNGVNMDVREASRVSRLLHGSIVNVFDDYERDNLLNEVTKVSSSFVSTEVDKIIQYYIKK